MNTISPGGRPADDSSLDRSPRKNWVEKVGGLPKYVRMVANALVRKGMPRERAIPTAINTMKVWATGKNRDGSAVSPKVQAAAAAALAEWKGKAAAAVSLSADVRVDASELLDLAVPDPVLEWALEALDLSDEQHDQVLDLAADALDLAPGDYRPPYDWKHGFIPLTPAAVASKAGRGAGAGKGRAKPPKGKRVAGSGSSNKAAAKAAQKARAERVAKAKDDEQRGRGVPGEAQAAQNAVNASGRRTPAEQKARDDLADRRARKADMRAAEGRTSPGKAPISMTDDEVFDELQRLGRIQRGDATAADHERLRVMSNERHRRAEEGTGRFGKLKGKTRFTPPDGNPHGPLAKGRGNAGPGMATTSTSSGDFPATGSEQAGQRAAASSSARRLTLEAAANDPKVSAEARRAIRDRVLPRANQGRTLTADDAVWLRMAASAHPAGSREHDRYKAAADAIQGVKPQSSSKPEAPVEKRWPKGQRVRAGVAGNDNTVLGTVTGHTDNGMLRVTYKNHRGESVTGTFNPAQARKTNATPGFTPEGKGVGTGPDTPPDADKPDPWGGAGDPKPVGSMSADELRAERDRMNNYINGRAGGTASDEDVARWTKRRNDAIAALNRKTEADRAAGRSAGSSDSGQQSAPKVTPGGITADTARRMSDEQLERAMSRLMADNNYNGPAFKIIEAELNRRDAARAEGNRPRR